MMIRNSRRAADRSIPPSRTEQLALQASPRHQRLLAAMRASRESSDFRAKVMTKTDDGIDTTTTTTGAAAEAKTAAADTLA
jgi:predicted phosphoribosyltransferase